jgi:large conductance mechanosensitive channel
MFREFKTFVMRGNVLELAVGIVFGTIVNSLVKDIIMPPVAFLLGVVNINDLFMVIKGGAVCPAPYRTLTEAQAAGALTLNYGAFLSTLISFFIISLVIFFVISMMKRARKAFGSGHNKGSPAVAASQCCPVCHSPLSPVTGRCPACTPEPK